MTTQIISPSKVTPIISLVQDSLLGIYLSGKLSKKIHVITDNKIIKFFV